MAELRNREKTEEDLLLILLALFGRYRVHDDEADRELREILLYWLGLIFVRSAVQHGASQEQAELQAASWVLGHTIRILSAMRRYSRKLEDGGLEVFTEERASRLVITEVSEAASAGAEFAALASGSQSENDTWYTALDERVCPYCGPLHGVPRSRWLMVYQQQILPVFPQGQVYGIPTRTPAHPNCRCFIIYSSGAGDE